MASNSCLLYSVPMFSDCKAGFGLYIGHQKGLDLRVWGFGYSSICLCKLITYSLPLEMCRVCSVLIIVFGETYLQPLTFCVRSVFIVSFASLFCLVSVISSSFPLCLFSFLLSFDLFFLFIFHLWFFGCVRLF